MQLLYNLILSDSLSMQLLEYIVLTSNRYIYQMVLPGFWVVGIIGSCLFGDLKEQAVTINLERY